jgi:hypothetical protein
MTYTLLDRTVTDGSRRGKVTKSQVTAGMETQKQ